MSFALFKAAWKLRNNMKLAENQLFIEPGNQKIKTKNLLISGENSFSVISLIFDTRTDNAIKYNWIHFLYLAKWCHKHFPLFQNKAYWLTYPVGLPTPVSPTHILNLASDFKLRICLNRRDVKVAYNACFNFDRTTDRNI